MRAVGVIVEFNPFHTGHDTHLRESVEISGREKIVAAMSGNFVQRGEPAVCDKWRRTKMALLAGVDIVIELPVVYVVSGADYFARGGVGILHATGIVDALSFGSESGDLAAVVAAGRVLAEEPALYKESLRNGLGEGLSFAAARGGALEKCLTHIPEGLLCEPNNGLAIEYCKALHLLGSPMEVFTTHRTKGGSSATKIRKGFLKGESVENFMPDFAHDILTEAGQGREVACLDDFSDILRYLVYNGDTEMGEGLHNRFRRFAGEHRLIRDLLGAVKTKRYTYTRLQRAVTRLLLGITETDMEYYENRGGPRYIRVLGFRRESAGLLGEMTRKASLPVITHGAAVDEILGEGGAAAKMLAKDLEAGDIYRIATGTKGGFRSERGNGVVII